MGCLFHKWDGCKCLKCEETRDEGHIWKECKCDKCGKIRDGFHNWVDDGKGIVQCSLCETKMINLDYFELDAEKRGIIALLSRGVLMKLNINEIEVQDKLAESIKKGLIYPDNSFNVFLVSVKVYKNTFKEESDKIPEEKYRQIFAKANEINNKLSLGLSLDILTSD